MPSLIDATGGFPFDEIPDEMLGTVLHLSPAKAAAKRAELARRQRDPAALARVLEGLPAASLAILELLLSHGAVLMTDDLCELAEDRYKLSTTDVLNALTPVVHELLVVPVQSARRLPGFGIVQPAGTLIAPLLEGLDLIEWPAEAFVASEDGVRNPRTFLAVCVATRHVDVRVTNERRPHRGAVKRLAKQLGIADDLLDDMLDLGVGVGLLRIDDDVLRPEDSAIAAAASGRYPSSPAVARARARLARGPVSARELMYWLMEDHKIPVPDALEPEHFAVLPGFAVGKIDEMDAVAAAPIAGGAAGHVTPSFEVMLPPESRLLDLVQVGTCCEWGRLDRAIVGRITKASVTRAIAAGPSAAQVLANLAAASRHPVPQNVEAAIRDWVGSTASATIATGHVIVVDAGARVRAVAALADRAARELAPGVFVVAGDQPLREIRTALLGAGVVARDAIGAVAAEPVPEPEVAQANPAGARLRARVLAWQRDVAFEGKRDDFLDRARMRVPAEHATTEGQLAQWGKRHGVRVADHDIVYPALIAVLDALTPERRGAMLAQSKGLPQLLEKIAAIAMKERPSKPLARARRVRRQRPTPSLLWQQVELRAGIEAAAAAHKALALELDPEDGLRYVRIERVIRRGTTWMVLGEDVVSTEPLAIQLDSIRAIAALPDDLDAYDIGQDDDDDEFGEIFDVDEDDGGRNLQAAGRRLAATPYAQAQRKLSGAPVAEAAQRPNASPFEAPRRPWRPEPGQSAPAGHVACPCGSGERYRSCCRDLPSA